MIGIYKITNEISGKTYIGQSINISRRLNQHKRHIGKNPMYEDMEKYGLENFSFEVIEECSIDELDDKEIYWIKQYNSFENGYNMTLGGQQKRQKQKNYNVFAKGITPKQWSIYYFLLLIAKENYTENEEGLVVCKQDLNITQITKILSVDRSTYYGSLKKLKAYNLIKESEDQIIILNTINTKIPKRVLKESLFETDCNIGDLLRIYFLLTIIEINNFSIRTLIKYLNHSDTAQDNYLLIKNLLERLKDMNLIHYTTSIVENSIGNYLVYNIK